MSEPSKADTNPDLVQAARAPTADTLSERKPRRWLWIASLVIVLVVCVPILAAIVLSWRLAHAPITAPERIHARIEAQIDAALPANDVRVGQIDVSLPDGLARPVIRFADVALNNADGTPRASFPELEVVLSGVALLQGEVQPTEVAFAGAGLQLRRDENGRFDLVLSDTDLTQDLSLSDSLARIDALFETAAFSQLERVRGSGIELAMADAVTGQTMHVRQAQLLLEPKDDVLILTVGGALEGSRDATLDIEVVRSADLGETNLAMSFSDLAARDVATVAPALAWLDLMRAPISGSLGGQLNDDGSVGDLRATLTIGAGELSVEGLTTPIGFNRISTGLRFDAVASRLTFDHLDLTAEQLSFQAIGHADVSPDGGVFVGQFRLSEILADPLDLFEAPVELDGATLDLRLDLTEAVSVDLGQLVLFDGPIRASARGQLHAGPDGLDIALDAHLPDGRVPELMGYWPIEAVPRTRRWIAENVIDGRVRGVDFSLRNGTDGRRDIALSLDFEDVETRVLRALPTVTDGAGYLSLTGPRFVLRLDEGRLVAPGGGPVDLAGSTMVIENTRQRGPEANIALRTASDLQDILAVLSEPPVRLFQTGNLSRERLGSGRADLQADITTRLMRQEGIDGTQFLVSGTVFEYATDDLVPGRSLTAQRLNVEASNAAVRISGQARFDGIPLTGQWSRDLGPEAEPVSEVQARVQISREVLAQLGVGLPDWLMSGSGAANISLQIPRGAPPDLTVETDLAGIGLALPPLAWRFGSEQTGNFRAAITLGDTPAVTELSLSAAGLSLEGRVSLGPAGGLARLTATRFRIDDWLDVTGALVGRGDGRTPSVELTGGSLDLRGAPQGERGGLASGGGGLSISATLDRLQVSAGIALTAMRADLTTGVGLSGQFQGRINGETPVTGTLVSTDTGPAVRVLSEDGGGALRSAGVYQSAFGGAMELVLQATGQEGSYQGTLTIDSPRLRGAPAMAELLNLISVVGLLEQLSGDGINLGEVDAQFRISPTALVLQQGMAIGPSMGISLDGLYDLNSGQVDMQGVVSPLYVVNGLIGALFAPRREGLFGFAYRLTGTAENTQVQVNPLSILTPGIFREIFRRPPPDLTEAP